MKCSNCSADVRPVVAVDIDGTLGDYHGHFINFAWNYFGGHRSLGEELLYEGLMYSGYESFRTYITRTWSVTTAEWYDAKLAYRQGGMKRTMPIFYGAQEFMYWLYDESGAEVWLTTTRPHLRLDGTDPDTRHWLKIHEIEYHGLLYDEDKYDKLAQNIDPGRVVAVVDDLNSQCLFADKAFGREVSIQSGWHSFNRLQRHHHRLKSFEALTASVNERLQEWRKAHG